LKKYDILVVYFTIPTEPGDAFQERQWQLTEEMLEVSGHNFRRVWS